MAEGCEAAAGGAAGECVFVITIDSGGGSSHASQSGAEERTGWVNPQHMSTPREYWRVVYSDGDDCLPQRVLEVS